MSLHRIMKENTLLKLVYFYCYIFVTEVTRVTLFKDQVYEDFGFSGNNYQTKLISISYSPMVS